VPGFVDGHATRRIVVASIALGLLTAAQASAVTLGPGSVLLTQSPRRTSGGAYSVLGQPISYVTVNGATLGYRAFGTGRPLVLIAGSSFTMAMWDPVLLDALAAQRRVIIFDNRGTGTSTGPVDALSIAQMADDTAQLIQQVARGPADVLGWSMGGYIAQELAIHHAASVRRLVLASTDCGGPETHGPTKRALRILTDPAASQAQRLSILFPRNRIGAAMLWSASIGEAYAADGYQPSSAFTISAATAKAQENAAGPTWLSNGGGTCDRLEAIDHQVLVVGGRDDVVVPISNAKALADGLPHATTRIYRDAGHAFLFQPGLKFAGTVNDFLAA
jgi:pimeloyl-ACP methyl ester carboxylesterase